jgi:hypothetical protein
MVREGESRVKGAEVGRGQLQNNQGPITLLGPYTEIITHEPLVAGLCPVWYLRRLQVRCGPYISTKAQAECSAPTEAESDTS